MFGVSFSSNFTKLIIYIGVVIYKELAQKWPSRYVYYVYVLIYIKVCILCIYIDIYQGMYTMYIY